jgi:hypothetical protein
MNAAAAGPQRSAARLRFLGAWRETLHNRVVRALLASLIAGVLVAAPAGAGHGAVCGWHMVRDAKGPELWAATVLRGGELWAVGDNGARGTILHLKGGAWETFASPLFALDITAASSRDIWAVGSSLPGGPQTRPQAEHWDGTRWRTVPVPGRPGGYLRAVVTLSRDEAWAVGANPRGPLIERWNGMRWKPTGSGPLDGLLHGIDALTPDAIWAVGTQGMQTLGPQSESPLVERLEGGRWQRLPTPPLEWVDANLLAVDAVSPTEAWAVGSADIEGGRAPLVERWDGQAWSVVSTEGLPATRASLSAVAAFSPEDVWAGGWRGFGRAQRALLAHWDGRRWSSLQGAPGAINDLAARSTRDIWAVGGLLAGGGRSRTLVEHFACV